MFVKYDENKPCTCVFCNFTGTFDEVQAHMQKCNTDAAIAWRDNS